MRKGLLRDNHLIFSTAFLAEVKGSSSYQRSIKVRRAIGDVLTPSEIKSREGLSRYSYRYVVNRLINSRLVEEQGDNLVPLKKGLNVLSFGDKDRAEAEKAIQVAT